MKRFSVFLFSFLATLAIHAQSDEVGSGHALSFDGVDDYVEFGDIYDDLELPVSISAWVYLDPNVTYTFPVFNSQDNLPIYNGITFSVTPNSLSIGYGDGQGENNPAFRRGKGASVTSDLSNRWVHIAANIRGALDMDLFVNGVDIGGGYGGDSNLPMDSNSPGDVAKIGYWYSNGLNVLFHGMMDEVRLWNRSLTSNEIREQMCKKLVGSETGLIGYWNFNEVSGDVVIDKSANHFDGKLKGGVSRVYSGAPIGDESVFTYQNTWSGNALSVTTGLDAINVSNVSDNPEGIHIYTVNSLPSQRQGIDLSTAPAKYFGVFIAAIDFNNAMDVNYRYDNMDVCVLDSRTDNSLNQWIGKGKSPINGIIDRVEVVRVNAGGNIQLNLGPDKLLCNTPSYSIKSKNDLPQEHFLWSTGETSHSINVSLAGKYSVIVTTGCDIAYDTITLEFKTTPPSFSLGEDVVTCSFKPTVLDPQVGDQWNSDFMWQDSSKNLTLHVNDYGTYSLEIKNYCGSSVDTIRISPPNMSNLFIPNLFTPNGDIWNEKFEIDERLISSQVSIFNRWGELVYRSENYRNDWRGDNVGDGVYYYLIRNECAEEKKGPLTILK